jgi:hypothetical protein
VAARFDRPVTAADIAALGARGSPLERGVALGSFELRGALARMGVAMPTTGKGVYKLAKELGSRAEYFSCQHPAFSEDQSLLLGCLRHVAIASNAASVFPTFEAALAGAPAAVWIFDFVHALGLDALMGRSADRRQGSDPLQHLRDAMRPLLDRGLGEARLGATPPQRRAAREQLKRRIWKALAGDGRGRRGRVHHPFHVKLTYVTFLYRIVRARELLRYVRRVNGPWGAIDVTEACELVGYEDAFDAGGDQDDEYDVFRAVQGPADAREIAREVARRLCGLKDHQMKNILCAPIRLRSAK